MLGPKIKEDELEQAVDRIFEKFDFDKDSVLNTDEIAALLKNSFKSNRDVTLKEAEDFIIVLTGQSNVKVEKQHFIRWYRQIYCC